ncbi:MULTISPECIES: hypothetical protein [Mycobacteriaceae]|nr:hypothetical protein [Mycobacterium sp. 20091114027_K0903767]
MLLNLATVHLPAISHVLGPLHGLVYTATVVAAILLMNGTHRVWLLALIPGIGGLLAAQAMQERAGVLRPTQLLGRPARSQTTADDDDARR